MQSESARTQGGTWLSIRIRLQALAGVSRISSWSGQSVNPLCQINRYDYGKFSCKSVNCLIMKLCWSSKLNNDTLLGDNVLIQRGILSFISSPDLREQVKCLLNSLSFNLVRCMELSHNTLRKKSQSNPILFTFQAKKGSCQIIFNLTVTNMCFNEI